MGNIEEHYKNYHRLREEHDFDKAQIWDAVSMALDAKEKKTKRFIWLIGLLPIVVLIVLFVINYMGSISPNSQNMGSEVMNKNVPPTQANIPYSLLEKDDTLDNAITDIYNIKEQDVTDTATRSMLEYYEEPGYNPLVGKSKSTSLLERRLFSTVLNRKTHGYFSTRELKPIDTVHENPKNQPETESPNPTNRLVDSESIHMEKIPVLSCDTLPLDMPIITLPPHSDIAIKRRRIELTICGGFNQSIVNFDHTNTGVPAQQNSSTDGDLGLGIRGYVTFVKRSNFRFSIGAGLDQLNTVFNYKSTITFEGIQSDGLIGFIEDDDNIIPLLGDRPVTISQTRVIRHHNQIKALSFPLLIGHQFNAVRHSLCLETGITPRLILRQKGRSINQQNDIIYFSENPNTHPIKPFQISLSIHGCYRYAMSSRLSIQASVLFDQGMGRFSTLYNQNVRFSQLAIQTGLIYSLYPTK